jgi:hypothetical protein
MKRGTVAGCAVLSLAISLISATSVRAQNRGVYPLGMSATNSGVTPESGFTYTNQFVLYSRDQAKDQEGRTLPVVGSNTVAMDLSTAAWVSTTKILGARYSFSATIPVAKNDLTSDLHGPIGGGSGLADSYYLPFILGWSGDHSAVRAMYGFLAPTGRFVEGASNNVGSGYWTHALSSGQTFYLSQRLTLSALQMYEVHTTQHGTGISPGDTLDVDYSLVGSLTSSEKVQLQVGLVGYEQRQTTAKSGPAVTAESSETRYAVNALGGALTLGLPARKASTTLKYFREFSNRSTFQGYSFQIAAAMTF